MILSPGDPASLDTELHRLLDFGRDCFRPDGTAGWLDTTGKLDPTRGTQTWITARMVHVHALAHLLGVEGAADRVDAGLRGLAVLHDDEHGGWFSGIDADGIRPDEKSCYAHAFVVLAASSATIADRPGAAEMLQQALTEWNQHFYDEATGRYVDTWDAEFGTLDSYRGVNGMMHSVEALLAAGDATGDRRWYDRALGICRWVAALGAAHDWRLPEHFDADWQPQLELNADRPADPFKPYGATVGHGLEWARLLLDTGAAVDAEALAELTGPARSLFERAAADGWAADGHDGFLYTTDWSGAPVVTDRMHWVAAEAVAAAAALGKVQPDDGTDERAQQWWNFIADKLADPVHGSWFHQLDQDGTPIDTVWPGKPDLYHAVQATLIPRLPLAPGPAAALRAGFLEVPLSGR